MQARITLLESIKNLDKTKLDMLGQVMSTQEFKNLDGENNGQVNYESQNEQGQNLIELDIETLSMKKIKYLQAFIDGK